MLIVRRWLVAPVLVVAAAGLLGGCGSLGPSAASAADVAQQFHASVGSGDGARACALLAPGTAAELEDTSQTDCASAVLDEQLPATDVITHTDRAGRGARVVLDHDVVFLSVFDNAWKVTAAGCTPRSDAPYDCTVKGG